MQSRRGSGRPGTPGRLSRCWQLVTEFRYNIFICQHLPWANNRPYNDGDLYNCLVIETLMKDVGKPHFETGDITVIDEVMRNSAGFYFIPISRNAECPTVQSADLTRRCDTSRCEAFAQSPCSTLSTSSPCQRRVTQSTTGRRPAALSSIRPPSCGTGMIRRTVQVLLPGAYSTTSSSSFK